MSVHAQPPTDRAAERSHGATPPAVPFGLLALGWALLVLLVLAAPAGADIFGPIALASQSEARSGEQPEQADYAHDPAISGDGRYVAFDGSFGGVRGVWRRDLQSGAVQPVAIADQPTSGASGGPSIGAPDAELPSISADGRYVSFTTTARLSAGDTNSAPDIYVRDMDVAVYGCGSRTPIEGCDASLPACEVAGSSACTPPAGAFALASVPTGAEGEGVERGLTYETTVEAGETPQEIEEKQREFAASDTLYGSLASGRSALSADGRQVAFVTSAVSNLDGPQTPPLQVAVRDLETQSTELVSVAANPETGLPLVNQTTGGPEPVSGTEGAFTYGAVFVPGAPPPRFALPPTYALARQVGASISADGSTVAWLGQDISEQVKTLPGEALSPSYSEPLWRRIADGPAAPTLAVSGDSDPLSPACIASGEIAPLQPPSLADPCQGPFRTEPPHVGTSTQVEVQSVPQLSGNGLTVAFLANAPLVAQGSDFGEGIGDRHDDLFVADMAEGMTRTQALRPLTELASANLNDPATTANIIDFGLSPDGTQVAFTTQRTVFPLGSPAYVSAPAATPGMAELFDVDLSDDTLTRVTGGFAGGPSEHPHPAGTAGVDPYTEADGALSPSFDENGRTLAFSSTASNLVYGDGNTPSNPGGATFDGSDAFFAEREAFEETPAPQYVSPIPPELVVTPTWNLSLSSQARRNGSVVLDVAVPAPGALRAAASAAVLVRTSSSARGRAAKRRHALETVLTRTVASDTTDAHGVETAQLVLTSLPRYRRAARETPRAASRQTPRSSSAQPGTRSLRQSGPPSPSCAPRGAGRSSGGTRHAAAARGRSGADEYRPVAPVAAHPRRARRGADRGAAPRIAARHVSRGGRRGALRKPGRPGRRRMRGMASGTADPAAARSRSACADRADRPRPDRGRRVLGTQPGTADHRRQRQHDRPGSVDLRWSAVARARDGLRRDRRTHRLGIARRLLDDLRRASRAGRQSGQWRSGAAGRQHALPLRGRPGREFLRLAGVRA